MKTHFINYRATIYCIKIENKNGGGVAIFIKDSHSFKKEIILALIVKQLRVSQLR